MWRYLKWIAAAAILVALAMAAPEAIKLGFLLLTPLDCGEEIGTAVSNKHGDVAAETLRVCFGLGAFVDYSITLQTKGTEKAIKLVGYAPSSDGGAPPTLRWIEDGTLMIDLGKIRWVSTRTDKVGPIRIIYSFTKAE
jgi:hypothetical protein